MKNISQHLLQNLIDILHQLNDEDYSKNIDLLHGNSIGKHLRHILNFYENLVNAQETLTLNYDHRIRNTNIESNKSICITTMQEYLTKIDQLELKKEIQLTQLFSQNNVTITTTLTRELIYNIEHTIHHMAIIRIALEQCFTYVNIPANFGIAPSTVLHREPPAS